MFQGCQNILHQTIEHPLKKKTKQDVKIRSVKQVVSLILFTSPPAFLRHIIYQTQVHFQLGFDAKIFQRLHAANIYIMLLTAESSTRGLFWSSIAELRNKLFYNCFLKNSDIPFGYAKIDLLLLFIYSFFYLSTQIFCLPWGVPFYKACLFYY